MCFFVINGREVFHTTTMLRGPVTPLQMGSAWYMVVVFEYMAEALLPWSTFGLVLCLLVRSTACIYICALCKQENCLCFRATFTKKLFNNNCFLSHSQIYLYRRKRSVGMVEPITFCVCVGISLLCAPWFENNPG